MITLEQAKALKPGDRVWTRNRLSPHLEDVIEWEVFTPDNPNIGVQNVVCFIRQLGPNKFSRAVITENQLYEFHLTNPERGSS